MLGNPKWFKRRKYTGWGLTPATWQGWAYLAAILCALFIVSLLTIRLNIELPYQILIILSLLTLIILDSIHMITKMDKDERETAHEALAERNAAWTMSLIITGGVIYQLTVTVLQNSLYIDPFLMAALLGGILAKGISNWYYSDK